MVEKTQRRLAAIIAADVAGYTRLMRLDEEATMAAWWSYRKEVIDPMVTDHGGRVVKLTGDGFLAEFASATDAVTAAITMQSEIASRVADQPEDRRVQFRMGVNLGDILWDEEDIYGDGVNIAARIEALAEPGGIFVSASIYDQVHHRLSTSFEDMGKRELKNINAPIQVYRVEKSDAQCDVVMEGQTSDIAAMTLPEKPSIAVLPFDNMSGDPEQEYFSDGISEDIITELARFQSLFVSARNSSFHYKGQSPKIQDVGRELGVQYVVEGSVRKAGNRVRITAQLIDARSGNHIWAERYDRELEDIFDVQDEVVQAITIAVPGHLEVEAHDQVRRRSKQNLTAYEYVLQGNNLMNQNWGSVDAVPFFEKAIEADPNYALAYAQLANWHAYSTFAHCTPADETGPLARSLAEKSLSLEPNNPVNLCSIAEVYLLIGDPAMMRRCIEKAIKINPNHYVVMIYAANLLSWLGELDEAMRWFELYTRHDPQHVAASDEVSFELYFFLKRFEDAAGIADGWQNPSIHLLAEFAAAYALAGRSDDATAMREQFESKCPPHYSIQAFVSVQLPIGLPQGQRDLWLEGYRKAGFNV